MAGAIKTDSADQRHLLDEFAAQIVCASDSDGSGDAKWVATLDRLISGKGPLATEAVALRASLGTLTPGEGPFFDAVEEWIGRMRRLSDSSAHQPIVQPEPSEAVILAQDPELIADFIVESREHLCAIEQNVLAVEQDAAQMDPIHAMFRAFHTIKGIAGFLEFQAIRDLSHETETLLDFARNGQLTLTPDIIDLILESSDYLSAEITRIENGLLTPTAPPDDLIVRLGAIHSPDTSVGGTSVSPGAGRPADTDAGVGARESGRGQGRPSACGRQSCNTRKGCDRSVYQGGHREARFSRGRCRRNGNRSVPDPTQP
jgi:HPt (histidine-containing phosphotransfer) domain-containing protein